MCCSNIGTEDTMVSLKDVVRGGIFVIDEQSVDSVRNRALYASRTLTCAGPADDSP